MSLLGRRTAFLYTDQFLTYNLGSKHPLQQRRLQMVYRLLHAYGALSPEGAITCLEPEPATLEEILRVHTPDFIQAVQRAGSGEALGQSYLAPYGLGSGDTPAFPGMFESASLYAGGTAMAARLVASGAYDAVFNVSGGLHHAHPHKASGFCTFNDQAMGIHALLDSGIERVICVDIDVHHGDGTQACFYNDPRVLTISLHEGGEYLFPGTGFPEETGGPDAFGSALNVPFFPYTLDDVWHDAFDAVVPAAFSRFAPQAVVLQLGADAHWQDPLAHVLMTSQGWMQAVKKLLQLSQGLPLVITGGGGYNLKTVARLWTMVTATCAGIELPDEVPTEYASQYDIPYLHDREIPDTEEEIKMRTRQYSTEMVQRLNNALALS